MSKKLDFNKIPEYTPEYGERMLANTNALIVMGVKDWKRKKKAGVAIMSEVEQKEMLRKIEDGMLDG